MKKLPLLVTSKAIRLILLVTLAIVIFNAVTNHNWPLLITAELAFIFYYLYIKSQLIDLQFSYIRDFLDIMQSRFDIIQSQGSILLEEQLNWHKEQVRQKKEKIQQIKEDFDISDAD